jgi:hypothetical protein
MMFAVRCCTPLEFCYVEFQLQSVSSPSLRLTLHTPLSLFLVSWYTLCRLGLSGVGTYTYYCSAVPLYVIAPHLASVFVSSAITLQNSKPGGYGDWHLNPVPDEPSSKPVRIATVTIDGFTVPGRRPCVVVCISSGRK